MLSITLGPNAFDAAAYVRQQVEDPSGAYITDDALQLYAEIANEEFANYHARDFTIGTPTLNSSPFQTVANQVRYVCNSANGFVEPPVHISDVLYASAGGSPNAGDESAYLYIMPFSPVNRFFDNPYLLDNPSGRIIREEYLNELAHYGEGTFGVAIDPATGLLAIDLWPIPLAAGMPVWVRYQAAHVMTVNDDAVSLPTIPANQVRNWAKLLLLEVLEQEGDRVARQKALKAGLVTMTADPKTQELRINRLRDEVMGNLGARGGIGIATH